MKSVRKKIPVSNFGFRLIEEILLSLENDEIDYCIMRGSDNVLGNFPSGDVDILVPKGMKTLRKINRILERLQIQFGYIIYAKGNHANVSRNFYLSTIVNGDVYTINLEFFNEIFVYQYNKFKSKKFNYLDTEMIIKTKVKNKSIYTCNRNYEFIFCVVDSLFNNKSKNFSWLNSEIQKIGKIKSFRVIALKTFGYAATEELASVQWNQDGKTSRDKLKHLIFRYFIENHTFPTTSDILRDFWSIFQHIKQYILPGGLFCLVMGTDGSGKTKVCDTLSQTRKRSFNKIHRIHLGNRPITLPSLRGVKINNSQNQLMDESIRNYHNYKLDIKRINLYQSLRFIYITLDYFLHYYLVIRPLLSRGDLIITERYFTDYVVIPERYFPLVPNWLKSFCYIFVPKPDLIIHLSVGIDQICARKKELPRHLIKYELVRFDSYIKQNSYATVDNTSDIHKTISNVEKLIYYK